MEYQKIENFLEDASDQPSKFTMLIAKSNLKLHC